VYYWTVSAYGNVEGPFFVAFLASLQRPVLTRRFFFTDARAFSPAQSSRERGQCFFQLASPKRFIDWGLQFSGMACGLSRFFAEHLFVEHQAA